jgi:acyl-CoA thioester hydrolase
MPAAAELRVRYAETDQMGIVYHANYIVWMEIGRVEACRCHGVSYAEMEADGFFLAVLGVEGNYHAPARYDDIVRIETMVSSLQSRMMEFSYAMYRASNNELLFTGKTKHMFLNEERRPTRLSEKYRAVLAAAYAADHPA